MARIRKKILNEMSPRLEGIVARLTLAFSQSNHVRRVTCAASAVATNESTIGVWVTSGIILVTIPHDRIDEIEELLFNELFRLSDGAEETEIPSRMTLMGYETEFEPKIWSPEQIRLDNIARFKELTTARNQQAVQATKQMSRKLHAARRRAAKKATP